MSIRILLVSPHPDDIAWSLGGTVSRLRMARAELHVLTLFTRTRYAPGDPTHGSPDATVVRSAEELDWADVAGVRLHRADLPDASLRGYDDDTEMGAPPEPEVVRSAAEHLRQAGRALDPHVVFAPLAVGGHIDHAAVREAAADLRTDADLLWYEDLPYAADGAGPPSAGHPVVVDLEGHWPAKEAGVRCFPSQLPGEVLPVLRGHAAAVAGERVWGPTEAAAERFRLLVNATQLTADAL